MNTGKLSLYPKYRYDATSPRELEAFLELHGAFERIIQREEKASTTLEGNPTMSARLLLITGAAATALNIAASEMVVAKAGGANICVGSEDGTTGYA